MTVPHTSVDSLTPLFRPRSVAIVGASDDVVRISGRPLRYLRESGFAGALLPVNPKRDKVQGLPAFPSITALPEAPDVALLAIPASHIPGAVAECAAHGVKSAVIFSSGFAETGAEGRRMQDEIRDTARAAGMRILGPNCLGVFNSEIGFYGTFASALDLGLPEAGGVAIASQSGAYSAHIAYLAQQRGLGVRYCVSTGNEADIEVGETLLWLARDPSVRVIMAYAEGLRESAAFIEALRTAHERRVPIVFMKVGRSEAGAAAIDSHTAALAGSDAVYDGLFRQYGVHRALTTDEQIDVAYACARGLYPRGRRLGIVTVSGGVGIQACDAAQRSGLEVPAMPETAQRELKALLPYAAVGNPVDVTAQALVDMTVLTRSLDTMLAECDYDALLGVFLTVPASRPFAAPLREAIAAGAREHRDRLIVMCMVADPDIVRSYEAMGFLVFEDSYRAVAAIAALADLQACFERGIAPPGTRTHAGATIGPEPLSEHDAKRVVEQAGIPCLPERLAHSAEDAERAAQGLGYPVALKIVSPDILHKTEIGGVLLDVADAAAVRAGYETLHRRAREAMPNARLDGVLVAPMAPRGGVETILGARRDPTFGPVVMFGLGGIFVELLRDVAVRLAPVDLAEAHRMIREVKGHDLLGGVRGGPPCDVQALARALVQLSELAAAHADDVESIEVNPFLVLPGRAGAVALDAAIVPRTASSR